MCVVINLKSVLILILLFMFAGIQQSQTAVNLMDVDGKQEIEKNNILADYTSVAVVNKFNETSIISCSNDSECINLKFPCIRCNYNYSCIYGKKMNINCEVLPNVQCHGDRQFSKSMICRYCHQTNNWEQTCILRGNCNSYDQYYRTNCSVHSSILCLGNRTFTKNLKCNWTQGYRWSTALLISLTLGGFGADRFYLGHWQEGIGKLFSFGGLGVWTVIDVLLISLHYLGPADGSLYI